MENLITIASSLQQWELVVKRNSCGSYVIENHWEGEETIGGEYTLQDLKHFVNCLYALIEGENNGSNV